MSGHAVTITGPHPAAPSQRYRVACSCGWRQSVSAVVAAAWLWIHHAKEAA